MISLGSSTIGIGLIVGLRDQFSSRARNITSQFNSMYGNAQRVQAANLRQIRNMSAGVALAGGVAVRGFANAYKSAADYDFILRTIQVVTGATADEFKQLDKVITDLGTNSIYTISDVASAVEYLTRSGFKARQAMAAIPAVVYLGASSGGKSIAGKGGIGDVFASILHDFNKGPNDAMRVADLLAKAANISASDVTDLGQALKYTGYQAYRMGYDIEPTVAMLTVLSNAGLKGGIAGRSLNAMLVYLNRAASSFRTGRQLDAFKAIGIGLEDILDNQGNLKSMTDILSVFGERLNKMTKVEASGALATLFMMRGERAMMPLLENSIKIGYNFRDAFKQIMNDSSGYSKRISEYIMQGPKGTLMRLEDTFYAFRVKMGQILEPYVEPILNKVLNIVQGLIQFSQTPLGKAFVVMAAGLSIAAVVGGTLLATFAAIKLITMAGTITFGTMGKTLVWAWSSAAAAAARYALVARGATQVGPGLFAVKGMKGFQKIHVPGFEPGGNTAATSVGAARNWKVFTSSIPIVNRLLQGLGAALRIVTGPIGWIGTILSGLFGFWNIIKGVILALGMFLNSILYVTDYIYALVSPFHTTEWANRRFQDRTKRMMEGLGFDSSGIMSKKVPDAIHRKMIGFQEELELDKQRAAAAKEKFGIKGNVYMDGREVGKILEEQRAADIRAAFELKN